MAGVIGNTTNTENAAWANSAAAGTAVNLDYGQQVGGIGQRGYAITVRNPSAVSALTVKMQGKETFASTAYYPEIDSLAVPAGSVKQFYVDGGWLDGEGGRLALTNDTVLGAGDGFTANVRVRQI